MKKGLIFLISSIALLSACSEAEHKYSNINNTYYVEIINANDSLRAFLTRNISGKAAYYKENMLQIVPETLMAESELTPEKHYFRVKEEMKTPPPEGTLLIKLELKGDMKFDSTYYTFPRFRFTGNEWKKISDIGFVKVSTKIQDSTNSYIPRYLGKELIQRVMTSTY